MRRRRRPEPLWPLAAVLVLVAVGLGIAALVPGGLGPGEAARAMDEAVSSGSIPPFEGRVRVEILNAGGVQGVASRARDHLREDGFDVVYFGNAADFDREVSVVLARAAQEDVAAAVASSLGIQEVRAEPDPTRLVDVTVLLGSDWDPEGGR